MTNPLKKNKELGFEAFGLTLAMAILLFLPFVIYNRGYVIYYGDFNAQQIPFYQLAHQAIRGILSFVVLIPLRLGLPKLKLRTPGMDTALGIRA